MAYKTVELDESLGGEPSQHMEVQGHETQGFKSLFKAGIMYIDGGIATGFKSAKEAYRSYIQAYASHALKNVFDVDKLDLTLVAKSFGFQVPPPVNLSVNSSNKGKRKGKSDFYKGKGGQKKGKFSMS